MLNFNFSEKGVGLVSPPHFVSEFSRKMVLMLHTIIKDITSLILLNDQFNGLGSLTSRNIGQYVYYNCLLTKL